MISQKDYNFLSIASNEASKSNVLMRHGCVAVVNGKVLEKAIIIIVHILKIILLLILVHVMLKSQLYDLCLIITTPHMKNMRIL